MVACNARDDATQQFILDPAAGTLASAANKRLYLGAIDGSSLHLTAKGTALRFNISADGALNYESELRVLPGTTCLDSHCGNGHAGDCRNGAELFKCCAIGACQCNQQWTLQAVTGKLGVFAVVNGGAKAGKPDCHRTQGCLAACKSDDDSASHDVTEVDAEATPEVVFYLGDPQIGFSSATDHSDWKLDATRFGAAAAAAAADPLTAAVVVAGDLVNVWNSSEQIALYKAVWPTKFPACGVHQVDLHLRSLPLL